MLDRLGALLRKLLPLGNSPKQMILLFVFVALFLLFILWNLRAPAAELRQQPYVQFSLGQATVRGHTSALNIAWTWPSPQRSGDAWVGSITLIGASDFNGAHVRNNFALAVQYVTGFKQFDLGIGPSYMETPWPYNGSRVNFNLTAAYRFRRWPITLWWNHFSCGGACEPNLGRDMAFVGYRF